MAKENTLQYILLGLLHQKSQTGYDLKKSFEEEIGDFWHASHGQIYPELQKLERSGFIKSEEQGEKNSRQKKYYAITEKGEEQLDTWLSSSLGDITPSRDTFTMKLYLIHNKKDARIPILFAEEIERHEKRLAYLKLRSEIINHANYGHDIILQLAIDREESRLRMLKKLQKEI